MAARAFQISQQEKAGEKALAENQRKLVEESKTAIQIAGISAPYLARHFHVFKVIDNPGDRRVIWKFSVNEYETTVSDSIGYYTAGGKRINTHSITGLLTTARDIANTIPRQRAEKLMSACIGKFVNAGVIYQAVAGRATLLFTAESASKPSKENDRSSTRERAERTERARKPKPPSSEVDIIQNEDDEGNKAPVIFGAINLETGRCSKGRGVVAP